MKCRFMYQDGQCGAVGSPILWCNNKGRPSTQNTGGRMCSYRKADRPYLFDEDDLKDPTNYIASEKK